MILVVGSTGMMGSGVCLGLAAQGKAVRALVRETSDPTKVDKLRGQGIEIFMGDLRDPASLKSACEGIETVVDTVSAVPFSYVPGQNDLQNVDTNGAKSLIDAAKAAGVKHFIYTSFSKNMDADFPLRNAKREVEAYLKTSGLTYTILRPGYFMEAWLSPMVGFDAENAKATIYGSGDQPISYISLVDVIQFEVASVTSPAARDNVLEVGGPQPVSPNEVVKLFEAKSGKTFETSYVPAEALKGQMEGATDPMQKSFAGLMYCYALGDPIDMQAVLQAFPLKLTFVQEFVNR
jgi:nucleoside-diphosphate-sugar epimerase